MTDAHPSPEMPLPAAVERFLTEQVNGYRSPGSLLKFGFGQSNPTYRLRAPSGEYVLRSKPRGPLLPKAHAIEREFRVLQALEGTCVPVPKVYALCADPAVLGSAFYVMELVRGRLFYDQRMPGLSSPERAAIFDGMNRAIAQLHSVIPEDVGLGDFGRGEGFIARQVSLWTRQYRASETQRIEAMEKLIAWLPENLPPPQQARIFHGDLRLDNLIFHETEPRVVAFLDWELSTLGDPIADFAYHAMSWRIGAGTFRGFADLDRCELGIPEESDYLRTYCERAGCEVPETWLFYLAFSLFRVAAIMQGVRHRAELGNASAANAAEVGAKALSLAELGWGIARGRSAA